MRVETVLWGSVEVRYHRMEDGHGRLSTVPLGSSLTTAEWLMDMSGPPPILVKEDLSAPSMWDAYLYESAREGMESAASGKARVEDGEEGLVFAGSEQSKIEAARARMAHARAQRGKAREVGP